MSDHPRNIGPMQSAPRCGARTRSDTQCRSPAISGKTRCRMHGGKGSGAPKGNRNALRRGLYTKAVLARQAKARDLRRRLRATIQMLGRVSRNSLDTKIYTKGAAAAVAGRMGHD